MIQINKLTDPLDYVLNCCEQGLVPERFDVLNAKDELKRLRTQSQNSYDIMAWARINDRGDLFDLRLFNNPYINQNTVLPLYANREQFQTLINELKKP